MKTKIPTEKGIAKLISLYTKFHAEWGRRYYGDQEFLSRLKNSHPTLVPSYLYLVKTIPDDRRRRDALLGKKLFQYTCKLCGSAMCRPGSKGKEICSNSCVKSAIAKMTDGENPDWSAGEFRYRGGDIVGLDVTCNHCGVTKDMHLHYFLAGYSCICRRGTKISATAQAKYGHEGYVKSLEARGVQVELLGTYINQGVYLKFKCLKCSSINESLPQNILNDKACFTCGQQKYRDNCLAEYGVTNHCLRPEVVAQRKATMLERYNVEYPLQNKELFEKMLKSSYCRYEYVLGKRTVRVQGVESLALDWLLANTSMKASQLRCGSDDGIPTIKYWYNGKEHTYFPDIYVPSRNVLIEVKSKYTYQVSKKQNEAKRKGAKAAGYKFVFLVMNPDGTRCNDYKTD